MFQRDILLFGAAKSLASLMFLLLIFLQLLAANPFPYSDDWHLVSRAVEAERMDWGWLWEQHVDHRIPIQKFVQVLLLRVSSVDFRVLVLANALFAYLVTRLLLSSVVSLRGRASVGDFAIPLILMNPGFGPFNWGFHLNFMLSVLLALCILTLVMRATPNSRAWPLYGAGLCALVLAFNGMNGAIFSAIISASTMLYLVFGRRSSSGEKSLADLGIYIPFALALAVVAVVFFSWQPSEAAGVPGNVGLLTTFSAVSRNFVLLISPRSWALPPVAPVVYYGLNLILLAVTLWLSATRIWKNNKAGESVSQELLALNIVLGSVVAVLGGIAIGRSSYWEDGLEMHYGYLATLIPIVCWIVISIETSRRIAFAAGLIIVLVYGSMYIENFELIKKGAAARQHEANLDIYGDLAQGITARDLAEKRIGWFHYVDTEVARRPVEEGLLLLKKAEVQPYAQLKQ